MVASLEPSKDHSTLLRAFATLRRRGQNFRLRLVGEGSLGISLRRLAEDLGIAAHVDWAGRAADVGAELAQMDLFAFAATEDEGLGIALVEALASGLPVVATSVGACREVLQDGRLGVLVEPGNPEALAEGILKGMGGPPVPLAELAQFDIADTWRAYSRLLEKTH